MYPAHLRSDFGGQFNQFQNWLVFSFFPTVLVRSNTELPTHKMLVRSIAFTILSSNAPHHEMHIPQKSESNLKRAQKKNRKEMHPCRKTRPNCIFPVLLRNEHTVTFAIFCMHFTRCGWKTARATDMIDTLFPVAGCILAGALWGSFV